MRTAQPARRQPDCLWRVDLSIDEEAEDAAGFLMETVLGTYPSVYRDLELGRTVATVFLAEAKQWNESKRRALRAGLEKIREAGLSIGSARIRCTRMARENWAESWKRHFRPLLVANRVLIKPTWSRRKARPGQVTVLIDPGLSFGTGHHPTTKFCLEQMAAYGTQPHRKPPSLLDVGCGSGILSIAAVKLGYAPVEGFDHDPAAVRVAGENARLNRVSTGLKFVRRDLERAGRQRERRYKVVCANVIENLLVQHRDWITDRVVPGGILVLAGILKPQFPGVVEAYGRAGWTLKQRGKGGEWTSGAFVRSA